MTIDTTSLLCTYTYTILVEIYRVVVELIEVMPTHMESVESWRRRIEVYLCCIMMILRVNSVFLSGVSLQMRY
jgi:hypothetical protein